MKAQLFLQGVEVSELLTSVQKIIEQAVKASISPQPPQAEQDRFIDQKEVAKIFGISTVSVWQWERLGLLQSYRIGNNLKRFKLSEVLNSPKAIERGQKGGKP